MRRPLVHKGRAVPYSFSVENLINDFDLKNITEEIARRVQPATHIGKKETKKSQ